MSSIEQFPEETADAPPMSSMPTTLEGWKSYFVDKIDEARAAELSDDDREDLVEFLREEVELILFETGPLPPEPEPDRDPSRWWDR